MKIDLHMHSVFSDGLYTPGELAGIMAERGAKTVSLTDHDTVGGTDEMRTAAAKFGMRAVTGVELTAFDGEEIHLLAYNFSCAPDSPIMKLIARLTKKRVARVHRILDKLDAQGIVLDRSALPPSPPYSWSRRHIAAMLTKEGYTKSEQEAMRLYVGKRGSAFVDFEPESPGHAVKAVCESGGTAVLAHPGRLKMKHSEVAALTEKLVKSGLRGIETFYPAHNKNDVDFFRALAMRLGLLATIGSDFHDGAGHRENDGAFLTCDAYQAELDALF